MTESSTLQKMMILSRSLNFSINNVSTLCNIYEMLLVGFEGCRIILSEELINGGSGTNLSEMVLAKPDYSHSQNIQEMPG